MAYKNILLFRKSMYKSLKIYKTNTKGKMGNSQDKRMFHSCVRTHCRALLTDISLWVIKCKSGHPNLLESLEGGGLRFYTLKCLVALPADDLLK